MKKKTYYWVIPALLSLPFLIFALYATYAWVFFNISSNESKVVVSLIVAIIGGAITSMMLADLTPEIE